MWPASCHPTIIREYSDEGDTDPAGPGPYIGRRAGTRRAPRPVPPAGPVSGAPESPSQPARAEPLRPADPAGHLPPRREGPARGRAARRPPARGGAVRGQPLVVPERGVGAESGRAGSATPVPGGVRGRGLGSCRECELGQALIQERLRGGGVAASRADVGVEPVDGCGDGRLARPAFDRRQAALVTSSRERAVHSESRRRYLSARSVEAGSSIRLRMRSLTSLRACGTWPSDPGEWDIPSPYGEGMTIETCVLFFVRGDERSSPR